MSGCVNIKFGQENNSITESSVDQEAANSQSDNEHLSVIDRYDLKASEFRQYFPQPPAAKSVEDELEEAREKLGLKKMKTQKNSESLQEDEDEPRYEISKMEELAQSDLLATNWENQGMADRVYGNGVIFGREIDQQIKKEEDNQKAVSKKQLDSQRQTFLQFV